MTAVADQRRVPHTARDLHITAVGGPTAVLEFAGLRIVTDPTFDAPRDYPITPERVLTKTEPSAFGADRVGTVDAVLLSHDHHVDNLDESGRAFIADVPVVFSTGAAAGRIGGVVRELPLWEHAELVRPDGGVLRVTRVPALHGPEGTEHLVGEVAGFVLSGEGLPTVYVSGDNASLDLVREIADRFERIDIALLFAGAAKTPLIPEGHLTLTSAQTAEAAEILGAAHVVPLHFNSWAHFTEGIDDLRDAFAAAGLTDRVTLLAPGEATTVRVAE
ncbi:MBL fold metallo-hydrolase [Yinghuangia seranimata]|uniref:MBL fold metallo-hydrolase n=1 Tax=Yinghuangia seranimata TaxID=408067 RepID=UPI00248ABEF4|nr:MBL fold metallo-hydrolase [Yinghuangia seranimata]MDI2130311.1 MBL fold metallo-hydrolase [Yinghuangia seranimata]